VVSGKRFDRPGLTDLVDHARPGDTLWVVRLDRLWRSLKKLMETVDERQGREVNFMSLEEKIDTASAAGKLIFDVVGAIAQFERRLIGERTRDGLAAAKARGARAGRPPLDQDEVAAPRALVARDMSPTAAGQHLGLGRSTLNRELLLA